MKVQVVLEDSLLSTHTPYTDEDDPWSPRIHNASLFAELESSLNYPPEAHQALRVD